MDFRNKLEGLSLANLSSLF